MNPDPNLRKDRFELRLSVQDLAAIDSWRREQPLIPTRAEAVRRLISYGLIHFRSRLGITPDSSSSK